jgi:RNA polymerase sigma-70 factor (ECF subfamily)
VAHNWITDYYRQNKTSILPLQPDHAIGHDRDLSLTFEMKMERQRIRSALTQLTPDQRQVIVLRFLEGWKTRAIAESLGKTSGAVKALQHRALMALKRQLVKQEEAT